MKWYWTKKQAYEAGREDMKNELQEKLMSQFSSDEFKQNLTNKIKKSIEETLSYKMRESEVKEQITNMVLGIRE